MYNLIKLKAFLWASLKKIKVQIALGVHTEIYYDIHIHDKILFYS